MGVINLNYSIKISKKKEATKIQIKRLSKFKASSKERKKRRSQIVKKKKELSRYLR